ncbi:MAG: hypothetical protein JW893_00090 [Candidatus Omnitrophica bacterium]|nr:hypothetical protein [Candidatus Omnitrophota bacterium]
MIQWFYRDLGLKLIALFLAVGLWYYAVGEEGIEVTRSVPLEIELKNEQMSILKKSVEAVQVTFLAPRAVLSELTVAELKAKHTIGQDVKTAGDYSFRVEAGAIELPDPQIRVVGIDPEVVHVTLDELIVQKLKIQPNLVGDPAFGYTVDQGEIQLNPNAILIGGPKGQLEQLDAVQTEPIDLVGRIRSFRRTVTLDLPPNVKPMSEAMIDVYIPIREELGEKTFENIPVKVMRTPDGPERLTIEPSSISFALKGSVAQLERLIPEKILAYVDVSELPAGEHRSPVKLFLPEGVNLKDEAPGVTIQIRKG